MLILTQGAFTIDLSRNVSTYNFEVIPSYSYNELLNGTISKKSDLGSTSDKYFCDLELCLSFAEFATFNKFYRDTSSGSTLDISTDLDLFFPNKYNNLKCLIIDIKDLGYLGDDIMTKNRLIMVRLYLPELQTYTPTPNVPTCFSRGIWKQDYTYSDKFKLGMVGITGFRQTFKNDTNTWVVSFGWLKRSEANEILSWILTKRTDIVNITTNDINGNLDKHLGWLGQMVNETKTSNYNIRSFEFKNENTYYSGSLELIERVNR